MNYLWIEYIFGYIIVVLLKNLKRIRDKVLFNFFGKCIGKVFYQNSVELNFFNYNIYLYVIQ